VRKQCARPGCSAAATATFTFDARQQTVWLDAPAEGAARAGELCERHVRSLTAPRGWFVSDRRHRAQDFEHLLDAHTPMLSRAFQSAGTV